MDFFSHKFTKHNNQCYFMAQNFNGIYRINLESGEMKFWASVPGERIGEKELFREIVCVDNKLFLIPDKATSIHVLDENANEIVKLKLEDRVSDYFKSKMKFISAFFAKGIIYLIPYGYPALIALDPYTYDMTYYDSFVYDCKKADHDLCAGMFMRGKYIKNEICLLHRSSNKLFFLNPDLKKYLVVSVGNKGNIYVDICFDGVFYWLVTGAGELLKWNRETNEIQCVFDYKSQGILQTITIGWSNVIEKQIFYKAGYIWIFSYCEPAVRIDKESAAFEVIEKFESGLQAISYNEAGGYNHVCTNVDELKLYVFCHYQNILFLYDYTSNNIKKVCLMSENEMQKEKLYALLREVKEDIPIVDDADGIETGISVGERIFRKLGI